MMQGSGMRRQAGFTVSEVMISLVLGLLVVGATIALFARTVSTNTSSLAMSHLDQELRAVMNVVTRDLRRAGHWGLLEDAIDVTFNSELTLDGTTGTPTGTIDGVTVSPELCAAINGATLKLAEAIDGNDDGDYTDDGTDSRHRATITCSVGSLPNITLAVDTAGSYEAFPGLSVRKAAWTIVNPFSFVDATYDRDDDADAVPDCVLFTYDRNRNGVLDTANPDERFGIRWDSATNTLEVRAAGADCDDAGWVTVNDANTVEITNFTVTSYSPPAIVVSGFDLNIRELQVEIQGRLANDNTVTRTVRETVRVRNDMFM